MSGRWWRTALVMAVAICASLAVAGTADVGPANAAADPGFGEVGLFEGADERQGPIAEGTPHVSVYRNGGDVGAMSVRITTIASAPADPDPPSSLPAATPAIDHRAIDVRLTWADGESGGRPIELGVVDDGIYEGSELIWLLVEYDGDILDPTYLSIQVDDTEFDVLGAPARVLDTRSDGTTADGEWEGTGRVTSGETMEIQIAGRTLADTGRTAVPIGAAAVAINVSAIAPDDDGFITLTPCTGTEPTTSALNYASGSIRGNGALVPLSPTGSLCVFSKAATDLTIDVTGYVDAGSTIRPVGPARVVDTRAGTATADGLAAGDGPLVGGSERRIPITGRVGVPTGATSVFVNLTALGSSENGFVTAFNCDEERPQRSNLNHPAGRVTGNGALVELSADGDICIFARTTTELVVDVTAYEVDHPWGAVAGHRIVETRPGVLVEQDPWDRHLDNGGRPIDPPRPLEVPVDARLATSWTQALFLNITVVDPAGDGHLRVGPCAWGKPATSTLNFRAGETTGNSAIVNTASGRMCVWTSQTTHLVVDAMLGWIAAD